MTRILLKLLTAAALSLVLLLTLPAAASAAPIDSTATPTSVHSLCSAAGSADYQYLPVERWSGATQKLHVRSNGGLTDFAPTQRQLQSGSYVVGDFLYGVTVKFVTWSTQFCPLQGVGGVVDAAAAQLGTVLVNSSLIAGLLICTVVVLLLQGFRNRDSGWLGRLGVKVLVVALFAIMVSGSTQSRGGGIGGDFATPYQPGRGSPGWFATTIDRIVTELAAAPAAALSSQTIVDTVGSGDQLDCAPYLGALQEGYLAQADRGGVISSAAVPALTVSNLWQISGYNAWSVGQFGNKNLNGQHRVACRMLDKNAAIPVSVGSFVIDGTGATNNRSSASITDVMSRVPQPDAGLNAASGWIKPDAPAWRQLAGVEADKGWIAWATCVPRDGQLANIGSKTGWKAPDGNAWLIADAAARTNADRIDGSPKLNQACWSFFNTDSDKVDPIFDWGDGDKQLRDHADEMPASVYDFISALHGTNQTAGGIAGFAYAASALGVLLVFGGLGALILLVKVITLVMLFSVFFCMAAVLLPNADNTKLVRFTKEYFGLTMFSAFAVFVLAMIILFVKIIYLLLGNFTGGPNSLMTMLLGGLAPVMAAFALHRAFVSIGMPSPMTVKGATGWGQAMAGGAAGGAVVAGTSKLMAGAKGLAASGGRKLSGSAVGGVKNKLGLNNTATGPNAGGGEQKSETIKPTEGRVPTPAASAATPEAILDDPTATPAAKRAAQRQRAEDLAAVKAEEREARAAAAEAAKSDSRPELEERLTARAAGLAQVGWDATKNAASDRTLDITRAAKNTVTHPLATTTRGAQRIPKTALGAAAVVGAATVGGLPGLAVVGGVVTAKKATGLVQRKVRAHAEAKQRALEAYRARSTIPAEGPDGQNPDGRPAGQPVPARWRDDDWADAVPDPVSIRSDPDPFATRQPQEARHG